MRVGTVAFATQQGLGILAKDFYDNGVITDVILLNHGRRENHPEWYPNSQMLNTVDYKSLCEFCSQMDVMFFFETPFSWELIHFCKGIGVKTVLMPMYECMPKEHYHPDYYIHPSQLDWQYYLDQPGQFIPVPVSQPWKLRTKAHTFVHNAGHGGLKGRNGTAELIESWQYVKSPVNLIIRSQNSNLDSGGVRNVAGGRMVWNHGTVPSEQLYAEGEVFIFPEKFNGLSLPLQEAYASGMMVMGTRRFPMTTWLPVECLIPVKGYENHEVSPRCKRFEEAVLDPVTIAKWIDSYYDTDILAHSLAGKKWAEENSWSALKPRYMEALEKLVSA